MKKKELAILVLSLLIPFSIVSCTASSEKSQGETNNLIASSNNETSENDIKKENVNIYYYDIINDKIVYTNKTIEVKNNNPAIALLDELKTSPNEDLYTKLSSEVELNSIDIDKDNSTITLDFSSSLVGSQTLGSGAESNLIKALCNTFGSYFNVDNIIITINKNPYSSSHILMEEGESFKVDLSNSEKLKQ